METSIILSKILDTYGKNSITSAIVYQFDIFSVIEENIFMIVNTVQEKLNKKLNINLDLSNIAIAMIYMYNSYEIIINLPHMLDNIKYKNKPSLHIVFGETTTQLVSVALFSEFIQTFNNIYDNNEYNDKQVLNKLKISNLEIIFDYNNEFDNELFENKSNYKQNLKHNRIKKIQEMYEKTLDISLNMYSHILTEIPKNFKIGLKKNNLRKIFDC